MRQSWTFSRKLALGLGFMAGLTLVVAIVAIILLRQVSATGDAVIDANIRQLARAQKLESITIERMSNVRAYLITRDQATRAALQTMHTEYMQLLETMQEGTARIEEREALEKLRMDATRQFAAADAVLAQYDATGDMAVAVGALKERVFPLAQALREELARFVELQRRRADAAQARASREAGSATMLMAACGVVGVAAAALLGWGLTRVLNQQVGAAVQRLQSSSSELQAAANQQSAGAREQVASMTQISTTMRELMATAKQIAESSHGVVRIADSTNEAAQRGDQTVQRARDEVTIIRRQIDLLVEHMLDLGRRSQQIGGVLEIITELAEQTNILAINATIEAAGAGEAGKRFSVVADEIRKLADRVGGSTKEIRGLIDQIRSAVNAAVMATESGSKAVDAGTRQFSEVTAVFREITDLLRDTTEAAREIELSTRQQSTAVEQTGSAVVSVAQSARETEASCSQVLLTTSELTTLARELSRLIRPQAA